MRYTALLHLEAHLPHGEGDPAGRRHPVPACRALQHRL